MKDKLILKNETEIFLESMASLSDMKVLAGSKEMMLHVWDELTEENLSEVTVINGDGIVVSRLADLVLVSETSIIQKDGSVLTSFCLREKDAVEKRIDAIESGQSVQDGAIMDMAEAISAMAE